MATTSSSGGCKGYWQTVQLKYKDGLVIQATLDTPTIQKLESGDNVLMEEIRKNVMASADKGKQDASDNSDTEASKEEQSYTYWPHEAVKLLIFLYKEYESEMENPAKKKKDVWQVITKKLNEAGFPLTQNRVECKWRNLLQSHKNIRDNKKKSGEKRKSFQYFEEIEDIVGKRHDISPPCTSGSLIDNGQKKKFKTHTPNVKAVDLCDSVEDSSLTSIDQTESDAETTDTGFPSTKGGNTKQKVGIQLLPAEVVLKIIQEVEFVDGKCAAYAVCRQWRELSYNGRHSCMIRTSALNEHCGLSLMRNLEELTIISEEDDDSIDLVVKALKVLQLSSVTSITLKRFNFGNTLGHFVDAVSHLKLVCLNCVSCQSVSLFDLQYILHRLHLLKFCIVDVNISNESDVKDFAEIANKLAGKVNFSLNTLDIIPSHFLQYDRQVYHCRFPSGQISDQ